MSRTRSSSPHHSRSRATDGLAFAGAAVAALVGSAALSATAGEPPRGASCKDFSAQEAPTAARGATEPARREEQADGRHGEGGSGRDGGRDGGGRDGDGRRGRGGDGRGGSAGPYNYDFTWGYGKDKGHGDSRPPRPQEWEETQSFMRSYAPRRQAALDQMQEGEAKESVKRFIFARYRGLQSLQRRDPSAYERRLAQLRVEDQIFGIVSDWGDAPDREQLRETLRTQVGQLVDLDLEERQRRVESLKRELAEQTDALARDTNQRDALVEKRVSRFAEWAGRWAERRKEKEAEKKAGGAGDDKRAVDNPTPQGPGTDKKGD